MAAKESWDIPPLEIEARSFKIIEAEAPPHGWDGDGWRVVRRMVHTSADFDYVGSALISPGALAAGAEAIRLGCPIVTDTNMALSGISARHMAGFGCQVACLVADDRARKLAAEKGTTRAMAAVDLAMDLYPPADLVWVFGNAPTALFRLLQRLAAGAPAPRLIVGLPVGFVNAAESKAALAASPYNFITNRGRKGGSNVAASVVNALADLAHDRAL